MTRPRGAQRHKKDRFWAINPYSPALPAPRTTSTDTGQTKQRRKGRERSAKPSREGWHVRPQHLHVSDPNSSDILRVWDGGTTGDPGVNETELRRCAAEPSSRRSLLLHAPGSISFCNASPWLYRGQGKGALSREGAAWELASRAEGEARTGLRPALQAAASPAGGRLEDRCETKPQEWCLPGSRRLCRRRWLLQTPVEEEEDLKAFFFLLWVWSAL